MFLTLTNVIDVGTFFAISKQKNDHVLLSTQSLPAEPLKMKSQIKLTDKK